MVVIYSGVKWFRALYMSIALLYARRLLTGCHSKSLNIIAEDVSYSACRMIRAARFCSLKILSILAREVPDHVTDP